MQLSLQPDTQPALPSAGSQGAQVPVSGSQMPKVVAAQILLHDALSMEQFLSPGPVGVHWVHCFVFRLHFMCCLVVHPDRSQWVLVSQPGSPIVQGTHFLAA